VEWTQNGRSSVLSLLGKIGSGKSTLLLKLLKKTLDDHNLRRLTAMLGEKLESHRFSQNEEIIEVQETTQNTDVMATGKTIVTSFFYSFRLPSDTSHPSDTGHKQMLASLLFQILSQDERLFFLFRATYLSVLERRKSSQNAPTNAICEHSWTFEELKNIFVNLVELRDFPLTIFLFVDAIDESDTKLRAEILELLTCAWSRESSSVVVKSAITSRRLEFPITEFIDYHEVTLDSRNEKDIERVVDVGLIPIKDAIERLDDIERSEYDLEAFKWELLSRAKGVILWTSLVLKLAERAALISPNEMFKKLDTLPDGLVELYEIIVSQLKQRGQTDVEKGKQWLKWVTFAERSLDIKEFREAVAISEYPNITNEIWRRQRIRTSNLEMLQQTLTTICGGFLVLRREREISTTNPKIKLKVQSDAQPSDTTVQLLHLTVKKFLGTDKAGPFNASKEHGHRQITNACIQYLKLSFSSDSMPAAIDLKNKANGVMSWELEDFESYVHYLEERPLLNYTLVFLPSHMEGMKADVESETDLMSQILKRIREEPKLPSLYIMSSWIQQIYKRVVAKNGEQTWERQHAANSASQRYWEAKFQEITSAMTEKQKEFSAKFLTTALVTAAMKGHLRAARALVTVGALASAFDNKNHSTALEAAARYGHSNIVNLFTQDALDIPLHQTTPPRQGSSVTAPGPGAQPLPSSDPQTDQPPQPGNALRGNSLDLALHAATRRGDSTIISTLLKKGAFIDSKDELGRSPVHLAARQGDATAISVFLKGGADIEAKEIHGQTPLWQAAANGHEEVVVLLLKAGADTHSKDKMGTTPLSIASKNGREAVIRRLLDSGADDAPLMANVRSIFMIPFDRHELFTGRGEELDRLHTILWPTENSNIYWAALVGLGGIG
jgi:ankyrin repeat protein